MLSALADWATDAPDEASMLAAVNRAPAEAFVPPDLVGQRVVVLVGCWCGDLREGEAALAPLRGLGPVVDLFGPMPYPALQGMLDGGSPPGQRNYFRGGYLADLDDDAISAVLEHAGADAVAAVADPPAPDGWSGPPGRNSDLVVQRTSRRLHVQPHRDLDRPHRRRHPHRCRPPGVDRPRTVIAGTSLRQLRHRQPGHRQLGVPSIGSGPPTETRSTTGWPG